MKRPADGLFRIALALPLAFGACRYALAAVRMDSSDAVGLVIRLAETALPALCLAVGVVLLLAGSRRRWPWFLVAAAGGWLVFVEVYIVSVLSAWSGWRMLFGDLIVGAYALLLSLSILLGASARSPDRPD